MPTWTVIADITKQCTLNSLLNSKLLLIIDARKPHIKVSGNWLLNRAFFLVPIYGVSTYSNWQESSNLPCNIFTVVLIWVTWKSIIIRLESPTEASSSNTTHLEIMIPTVDFSGGQISGLQSLDMSENLTYTMKLFPMKLKRGYSIFSSYCIVKKAYTLSYT